MDRGLASSVLREIGALYTVGTLAGLTDAQLLERFLARRGDEAEEAFAALMHRHGPTVLGVCRRMLPASHDAEDAFQATFLVLARRAAAIGRRERLANWLYGVAVRTAKEARRRSARDQAIKRRLMDLNRVASEPPEGEDEVLPLLDEELSRLPERYRSALLACELEGMSRREAASQLGIPEGTLSAHLARGRKLLRERLLRRGVSLGVGPIAGLCRLSIEPAIPERLLSPTVRAAVCRASGSTTAGTVSQTVLSLAERVVKMMFLARLTLVLVALVTAAGAVMGVVLALNVPAAAPAVPDPPKDGRDDLAGRVVDGAGTAVAGAQVWAIGSRTGEPVMVATATTDRTGRFVLPGAWAHKAAKESGTDRLGLFARARDGRVGWLTNYAPDELAEQGGEIELQPVGEVRGRVSDQDGRPIGGAAVAVAEFRKPDGFGFSQPMAVVSETAEPYRTVTAADGSFALAGIPLGSSLEAEVMAHGFGATRISWNTTQPGTVSLDRRRGRINGRLRPTDGRGFAGSMRVFVRYDGPLRVAKPGPVRLEYHDGVEVDKDGSFRFDGLPPGRYEVGSWAQDKALFVAKGVLAVEVSPNGTATAEVPVERLIALTGRVVDAETGKGIPDIPVVSYRLNNMYLEDMRSANTAADGRLSVPAQAGTVSLQVHGLQSTPYLTPTAAEYPNFEAFADRAVPDIKLTHAATLDGIVLDEVGHPVPSAEISFLFTPERRWNRREEPMRTRPDGTFHIDRLHPDDQVSLWARTGDATTRTGVIARPREGKVTLNVDAKYAVRIRGVATDGAGQRIAGAKVTLWGTRWYAPEKGGRPTMASGSELATYTTTANGLFVFRGLWPDAWYNVVVEARGHNKGESSRLDAKPGETLDAKIVLIGTEGHVAGRVVDSGGRPIAGAQVFNRGDAPELVAKVTDPNGRFRLDGLLPGTRFVFARKDGYRFTGVKDDRDTDDLTITLLKDSEPPPAWKPNTTASRDEQRAFARQILVRVWEKYFEHMDRNAAWWIEAAAEVDPDLAAEWSARKGHRYDDDVRLAEARGLAASDAEGALALLNQKPDSWSQDALQQLAERFVESDRRRAHRFAEEAAVQARRLNQPDRTLAIARAGAVLVQLGRADAGRKLVDEAARDAAQLPLDGRAAYYRGLVAGIAAPYDVDRALALIAPVKPENQEGERNKARIAAAIAAVDTKRALEIVDTVGGPAFYHEMARTAIAYQIGRDRPDDAIKVIEGIKRDPPTIWQAEAFGWLAVALAPRDRTRANALIDRALGMMIDQQDWASRFAASGGEMAGAAHVAQRARQIGYPDMESVVMRVLAARPSPGRGRSAERTRFIHEIGVATVSLALVDPAVARTVLEQIEARAGFDPARDRNTREPWLIAWSLVDLEKAGSVVDSILAALDRQKEVDIWNSGLNETVKILTTPPGRREDELHQRPGGAGWRPGSDL
jgi:RNA polymerase sigma factor (sigma-70 family)